MGWLIFHKFIALKDSLHVCNFCQHLFVLTSGVLSTDFLCVIGQISFAVDYAASVAGSCVLISPFVAV